MIRRMSLPVKLAVRRHLLHRNGVAPIKLVMGILHSGQ